MSPKTKPLVIIPFAGDDPLRRRNLEIVRDFYADNFPDWKILVGGFGSSLPFNRAESINAAIKWAGPTLKDAQPIVLNDADTLCTPEQVEAAVELATAEPVFVFAYTLYLRLGQKVTGECGNWRAVLEAPAEWGMINAGSQGCSAVRRSVYLELGGLDERFDGWGYEDLEFNKRADEAGVSRRLPGELRHMWHGPRREDDSPYDADAADVARNAALFTELTALSRICRHCGMVIHW